MPPFLRHNDGLRALVADPLSAVDIAQMLLELQLPVGTNADGYLSLDVRHYEDRFRVASFGIPSPQFTILMRLPRPAEKPGKVDPENAGPGQH
jgi:hypothetical protein